MSLKWIALCHPNFHLRLQLFTFFQSKENGVFTEIWKHTDAAEDPNKDRLKSHQKGKGWSDTYLCHWVWIDTEVHRTSLTRCMTAINH